MSAAHVDRAMSAPADEPEAATRATSTTTEAAQAREARAFEVIPADAERDARNRAHRIRAGLTSMVHMLDDIKAAWRDRDWSTLGYESWDAYVGGEFGAERLRLSTEQRRELVAELRGESMSTRAIAATLGVSNQTIGRDLAAVAPNGAPEEITGTDGKTYQPHRPVPPIVAEAVEDAQEVEHDLDTWPSIPDPGSAAVPSPPLPPPAAEPAPSVTEFLESDQELNRARYMHEFMKALTRSDDFMEFDAEELGGAADPELAESLDNYLIRVRNFVEKFRRARSGLRVVSGGVK